ncbi:hypothetical protein ASF41_23230 [Methylobacterium sp. Leaf111]|nr:hypothetical protein ASF41_23230 [Methylobacterium sp. Leaf111]
MRIGIRGQYYEAALIVQAVSWYLRGLMGWTAPTTASLCQDKAIGSHRQEPSTIPVSSIGLDLAKDVFQARGKVLMRQPTHWADVLPSRSLRASSDAEPKW